MYFNSHYTLDVKSGDDCENNQNLYFEYLNGKNWNAFKQCLLIPDTWYSTDKWHGA